MLRLVGLYHAQRGAHTYFLKIKEVPRPGGYVVNLLHYEDAASLAAAVSRPLNARAPAPGMNMAGWGVVQGMVGAVRLGTHHIACGWRNGGGIQ